MCGLSTAGGHRHRLCHRLFPLRLQVLLPLLLCGLSYWVHVWPCLCIVSLLQSHQSISSVCHLSYSLLPHSVSVHFRCFSWRICFLAFEFLLCSVELYTLLAGFCRSCFNFLPSFICSRPLCIHQYLKSRILKYFATFQVVYHLWKNRDIVELPRGFSLCFCIYSFTLLNVVMVVYFRCFPFLLLWVLFCVSFCSELSLLVIEIRI